MLIYSSIINLQLTNSCNYVQYLCLNLYASPVPRYAAEPRISINSLRFHRMRNCTRKSSSYYDSIWMEDGIESNQGGEKRDGDIFSK